MDKWSDYLISKLTFDDGGRLISEVVVHDDNGDTVGPEEVRNMPWMVQKVLEGKTFSSIIKTNTGGWIFKSNINCINGLFRWNGKLPKLMTKRKTFVSYYHKDDQSFREKFEKLFGDLVVSKSVDTNDIDSDNCDEYIKQLIQNDYLSDTTVLVVLVGPKTKCRKHVDWEISGALNLKVGENYAGLLGILLPSHPDYAKGEYFYKNLPERFALNAKSDYAVVINWTEDRAEMQKWIEEAFSRRIDSEKIVNHYLKQMDKNTCE
jgi:hypothetical protein